MLYKTILDLRRLRAVLRGGPLQTNHHDRALPPAVFWGSEHSAQECNYDIYDKELLAIINNVILPLEEWLLGIRGVQIR